MIITNNDNIGNLRELLHNYNYTIDIYNLDTMNIETVGKGNKQEQGTDDEGDVAIMLHTSGTTSDPKKVMLTNSNLISNIESNILSLGINENDVCLIVLPMFFGYCNSSQFLSHLYTGAKLVIYPDLFVPRHFLKKKNVRIQLVFLRCFF